MKEVKLHGFWASSFVYKVIWALKLKGIKYRRGGTIKYDYVEEDLSNKSELLLHHNPVHKKVPVLVHNEPISESLVILEYIEETWPQNPLLPKDAFDRAQARFWITFGTQKGLTFYSFFMATEGEKEEAAKEVLGLLKIIQDQCLGNKKFFGGDSINFLDVSFGWLTLWFECIQQVVGIEVLEPTALPRLWLWAKSFKEDSVKLICKEGFTMYKFPFFSVETESSLQINQVFL